LKWLFSLLLATMLSTQALPLYAFECSETQIRSSMQKDIPVPFHYQGENYYCGPASLEMVFDFYGDDVSQLEIADVARTFPYVTYTDELRRAAHFSNLSTSFGEEMPGKISGYSIRKLGYAAFERKVVSIDELKTLINNDYPIVVLMWYDSRRTSGHYRVVIGHSETHITLHDPWNKLAWGGTYGGPNVTMTYSTFLDLWEYSGYWALLTCPWNVTLNVPDSIHLGQVFNVTANVTYPCPEPFSNMYYPSSSCNATITLPAELDLASGEVIKKTLGTGNISAGGSATTNWALKADTLGAYMISVAVEGKVNGYVRSHGSYPAYAYEDRIGGYAICNFTITEAISDITVADVKPYRTIVGNESTTSINVTVLNRGSFETFNVTLYANATVIQTIPIDISGENITVITFVWNTTNIALGNYMVMAKALIEDVNKTDNTLIDGWITISITGDINADGTVNIVDLYQVAKAFQTNPGQENWNANADLNEDRNVNIVDMFIIAKNFGATT